MLIKSRIWMSLPYLNESIWKRIVLIIEDLARNDQRGALFFSVGRKGQDEEQQCENEVDC